MDPDGYEMNIKQAGLYGCSECSDLKSVLRRLIRITLTRRQIYNIITIERLYPQFCSINSKKKPLKQSKAFKNFVL